jgi:hypothetical protein
MKPMKPPQLDIVSTIALAHADNWVRHWSAAPFASAGMEQAHAERSPYRREQIRGLVRAIMMRVQFWRGALSQPIAPAHVRQG